MKRVMVRMVQVVVIVTLAVGVVGTGPVRAQSGDATVIPDVLNMRHGPGTEYAVIAKLARDTVLTLQARDSGGSWVYARAVDGSEGWLAAAYLDIRADLDVLALPVKPAPRDRGTPVEAEVTAPAAPEVADAAGGEDSFPEGTGVPAETTARVNMRRGASTSHGVITTLPVGARMLAKGRDGAMGWVLVSVGGQDGWVFGQYVRLLSGDIAQLPVSSAVISGSVALPETGSAGVTGSVPAPVYSGPGLASFGYGGHVQSFAYPDKMAYAGMTWVKRQMRFSPGMSGSAAAGMIEQAHGAGFKILLGIVGPPSCVVSPGCFEDYARFVGEVAALGPDAIEVWNEQNIDREWQNGHIDPARYTQLLALAYNAIKRANPNVAVISGAPAPTGAEGAFGTAAVWNDDRYVRGMAAAGAAAYMDCIGAHYNEGIVGPDRTSGDPRGGYYTRYFWGMVNTYSAAFGGRKPVCFTELGYLSPEGLGPLPGAFAWGANTSVAEQAQWLARAVQLSRSSGRVRLVIIWNVDFTNYGADPMAGYAIVRPDGACPACDALARIR